MDADKDIDLLKCDIEGSEFSFLDNYSDLLPRVKMAVFEFHKYGADIDHYRRLLCSYGFRQHAVLRDAALFSIRDIRENGAVNNFILSSAKLRFRALRRRQCRGEYVGDYGVT